MNRDAHRVLKKVHEAWQEALHGLEQMDQSSLVRPASPSDAIKLDVGAQDNEVKLLIGPIVLHVPERPNRRSPDLYVVLSGWLSFEGPNFKEAPLRTKGFGTEVGYFRSKAGGLEHVYGAHFDMDEQRPGHPVFHVQVAPQVGFGKEVLRQFRLADEVVNKMGVILGTVRTPSAQMDVFSVVTQVCADHLMGEKSAPEVRAAFKKIRNSFNIFVGAAHRLTYLNAEPAINCYRSTHWYDSPLANA